MPELTGPDGIRAAIVGAIEAVAPGVELRNIRPDLPLREQVDLDSMDWLNVLDALEQRLSMPLSESELGRLDTLDELVAHVAARRIDDASTSSTTAPSEPHALPRAARHLVGKAEVTVRPLGPHDVEREAAFLRDLSDDARYQRFMAVASEISIAKLRSLTEVDQARDLALAATVPRGDDEEIVGVARYGVDATGAGCEFAIVIADAWRRSGLAGILMHRLVDTARRRGLVTMEGFVLRTNRAMLDVARRLGFESRRDGQDGDTVRIVLSLKERR
ncbi:MAG: GNAT family N-acetyltransferase [Burkholderiaceae bacterium]|jgi:acetyltransferase|nr:GNAT family N-acetyltransferase [Burkholderiaceae bacterium]